MFLYEWVAGLLCIPRSYWCADSFFVNALDLGDELQFDSSFVCFCFSAFLETGFHHPSLAGLEFTLQPRPAHSGPPASISQVLRL